MTLFALFLPSHVISKEWDCALTSGTFTRMADCTIQTVQGEQGQPVYLGILLTGDLSVEGRNNLTTITACRGCYPGSLPNGDTAGYHFTVMTQTLTLKSLKLSSSNPYATGASVVFPEVNWDGHGASSSGVVIIQSCLFTGMGLSGEGGTFKLKDTTITHCNSYAIAVKTYSDYDTHVHYANVLLQNSVLAYNGGGISCDTSTILNINSGSVVAMNTHGVNIVNSLMSQKQQHTDGSSFIVPPWCLEGSYGIAAMEYMTSGTSGNWYTQPPMPTCTLCPSGKYGVSKGMQTEQTACRNCSAGMYSHVAGQTSPSACKVCQTGMYSAAGAGACTTCPGGRI